MGVVELSKTSRERDSALVDSSGFFSGQLLSTVSKEGVAVSTITTNWDWRGALDEIAPLLRSNAAAGETDRRLPETSMKALLGA
ncbi:MAG: hypothetical protein QOJ19_2055, partial [Acidimicrobiia bacterium]|nr:hypothetical protein [Acidimicrobiia bacterium]